jgi:hypothetical protein
MKKLRKAFAVLALASSLTVGGQFIAHAGSAHFVGTPTLTQSGNTLTVSGKVAGLGNETQITTTVTADASCVTKSGNEPKAENKGAVVAEGTFPVQNGKALFTVSGSATLDPSAPCPNPLTIAYDNVTVTVSGDSFDPDLVHNF